MINEHVPEAITVRTAIKRAYFIIFPQQNLFIAISGCYMNDNDNSGFSFTKTVFFPFFLSTHDFDEMTIWFFYESTDRSLTNVTISNDTRYIFHDWSEKKILWYLLVSKVSRLTVIRYFTGVSFFVFIISLHSYYDRFLGITQYILKIVRNLENLNLHAW